MKGGQQQQQHQTEQQLQWEEEDDGIECWKSSRSSLQRPSRRRGLAEAAAAEVAKRRIPNVVSLKGGVRGGHSVVSSSMSSTNMYPSPLGLSATDYGDHQNNNSHGQNSDWWPKGLTNVGNTCYANAALQCLLSTALTSALLDPKTVPILRRYSSNPNLLAMGSGSVDSSEGNECEDDDENDEDYMDEEEDGILTMVDSRGLESGLSAPTPKQANIRKNKQKKAKKKKKNSHNHCQDEAKRKEREMRKMQDNCKWLTQELTSITQEYMEDRRPLAQTSFASSFGSGGRSSMIGWLSSSNNDLPSPQMVVNPGSITRHPDRLSQCLRPYQQEDAHEFLRALLSTLVMNGQNKQLSSLFDGLLESSVTCHTCGRASLTRDRYMDLSLDINDVEISTLNDALYEFTKTELLTEDNAVFCQKCRKKRTVNKGLRLATAPSILVCHLKRFAFNDYGRLVRLHKRIEFPQRLDIGDYMSNLNKARPPPYDLVGILVHQGQTCASGHYLAFVKKHNEWFKCNDSEVTRVDEDTVMMQQAYILMYEVAEMRENACFQPTLFRKEASVMSTIESSDDATMSKESFSAHASHWSSDRSTSKRSYGRASSFQGQPPNESTTDSFLRLLRDAGVTQFISEMCCETSTRDMLHEPETHAMHRAANRGKGSVASNNNNNNSGRSERRRHGRRDNHAHECESVDTQDSLIRRQALLNHGSIQVLEVDRQKTGRSHRAQTAPRQRLHSDDYREPNFDVAPYTTYTPRASAGGGMHRKFPSSGGGTASSSSSKNRRHAGERPDRPSAPRYTMSERGREDLPPLHRGGKSNGTSNSNPRKTSSANVD
ncbi:ubiquitin carboxyl-terminal hydrolase [Nitzschia inconspicua]|uniref:Ubiquitin carboxyl-terminal hydrolase n=1 Tax=Nitzschia inconspicua TaxID=303405 RepID=A0A9K3KSA1_9STRA|nr:ubiquitin carboxyl-terminal hydrolase [Nitzschia inconspicua]